MLKSHQRLLTLFPFWPQKRTFLFEGRCPASSIAGRGAWRFPRKPESPPPHSASQAVPSEHPDLRTEPETLSTEPLASVETSFSMGWAQEWQHESVRAQGKWGPLWFLHFLWEGADLGPGLPLGTWAAGRRSLPCSLGSAAPPPPPGPGWHVRGLTPASYQEVQREEMRGEGRCFFCSWGDNSPNSHKSQEPLGRSVCQPLGDAQ